MERFSHTVRVSPLKMQVSLAPFARSVFKDPSGDLDFIGFGSMEGSGMRWGRAA